MRVMLNVVLLVRAFQSLSRFLSKMPPNNLQKPGCVQSSVPGVRLWHGHMNELVQRVPLVSNPFWQNNLGPELLKASTRAVARPEANVPAGIPALPPGPAYDVANKFRRFHQRLKMTVLCFWARVLFSVIQIGPAAVNLAIVLRVSGPV
jgi:hypothetical protein